MILFNLFISFFILSNVSANDNLEVSTNNIIVHPNAQPGDEVPLEIPLRLISESDEDFAIAFDPPSEVLTVSPSVAGPGVGLVFNVNSTEKLKKNGAEDVKLQVLGLISGDLQEVPLHISFLSAANIQDELSFEKDEYMVQLSDMDESQITILKLNRRPLSTSLIDLIGEMSKSMKVSLEGNNVYVKKAECQDTMCPPAPDAFSLLLVITEEKHRAITTLMFKKSKNEGIHFTRSYYEAEVEEITGRFRRLVVVEALGESEDINYALMDESGLFSIHPRSGLLTLQHPEFLVIDDIGDHLNLTATATDGLYTDKSVVGIKLVRKNVDAGRVFKFEQDTYMFKISSADLLVGSLSLMGEEGEVQMKITEGDSDLFKMEKKTIYYQGGATREDSNYTLKITAFNSDRHFSVSFCLVTVVVEGVGSSPLMIINGTLHRQILIRSESEPGLLDTVILQDDDTDAVISAEIRDLKIFNLNGNLLNDSLTDLFASRVVEGDAQLVLLKSLQKLPILSATLQLVLGDSSHPKEPYRNVTYELLVVRKESFNPEVLTPFQLVKASPTIIVPTILPVGTVLYTFRVYGKSADSAKFRIQNSSDHFAIGEKDGLLSLSKKLDNGSSEKLVIIAENAKGEKSQVEVEAKGMNSQKEKQKFEKDVYEARVNADVPIDTLVISLYSDNNTDVTMDKINLVGDDASFFKIDEKGMIRTRMPLDGQENYFFFAETEDSTHVAVIQVTSVDLSVHPYEEKEFNVTLPDNLPINSYVLHPMTTTKNSTGIVYSIVTDSNHTMWKDILEIDEEGRITSKKELYGLEGSSSFRVRASRGNYSAETTVNVQIELTLKCLPSFIPTMNDMFVIAENMPVGSIIGTVNVESLDKECNQRFAFFDPESNKTTLELMYASINETNGVITSNQEFDFEKKDSYMMILSVTAGRHNSIQTDSEIRIIDQDDHPVKFLTKSVTVEVSEDTAVDTLIATMKGIDLDISQKVFYHLMDEDENEFRIDVVTGEVRLNKALDREEEDLYKLKIGISNSEDKSEPITTFADLIVHVKDVNDNGPIFEHSHYTVLLEKDTIPGATLITVRASDPDASDGADGKTIHYLINETLFMYHNRSRKVEGYFKIDENTGTIQLIDDVSAFCGGIFHVSIRSSDGMDENARTDKALIKVYIHDNSDVIQFEMPLSPLEVRSENVEELAQSIKNATGLRLLVKDIGYHSESGQVVNQVTNVNAVLLNHTTSSIVSADVGLAVIDRKRHLMNQMPAMTKAQVARASLSSDSSASPMLIVFIIYAILLSIVFAIFGILLCYYRSSHKRELKLHEDSKIVNDALRSPGRPRIHLVTPPLPVAPIHRYDELLYGTQEKNMVVGVEEDKKR